MPHHGGGFGSSHHSSGSSYYYYGSYGLLHENDDPISDFLTIKKLIDRVGVENASLSEIYCEPDISLGVMRMAAEMSALEITPRDISESRVKFATQKDLDTLSQFTPVYKTFLSQARKHSHRFYWVSSERHLPGFSLWVDPNSVDWLSGPAPGEPLFYCGDRVGLFFAPTDTIEQFHQENIQTALSLKKLCSKSGCAFLFVMLSLFMVVGIVLITNHVMCKESNLDFCIGSEYYDYIGSEVSHDFADSFYDTPIA